MSDKALSMSLDDYIKNQKKGNKKGGKPGKSVQNFNARGKPAAKQGGRYFSRGGAQPRGGGGSQRGGGPQRGGSNRPGRGSGRPRESYDARLNRSPRGGARIRGGGRPKLVRPDRPSPNTSRNRNPRIGRQPMVGKPNLTSRPQKFGAVQRRPVVAAGRPSPVQSSRGSRRNAPLMKRVQYAASVPVTRIPRNPRVANRQVQQLIQKRIQKARITLTRKPLIRPTREMALIKPRGVVNRGPTTRPRMTKLQMALAQQKIKRANRARNLGPIRATRSGREARGLVLDRSNVRVQVRNEAASSYAPYRQDSRSMYGYPPPLVGQMGMRSDEFPPIVLNNPHSTETFQQVLDPEIQRKIAMIQNRAKTSRSSSHADIIPDFRGPVSVCKLNPGDRFRMLMN